MDIYRAAWLLPVDSPPISNGAMAVADGWLTFVGAARDAPAGKRHDLGEVVLLPGFVNAHTHLELSAFKGRITPRPLWEWFDELLRLMGQVNFAEIGPQAVRDGAVESLAAGVTCVADISRTGLHVPVLLESPLRKVCFLELISGARLPPCDPSSLWSLIERYRQAIKSQDLMLGLAPHAPYTVLSDHLSAIVEMALKDDLPITLHALETAEERDWFDGKPGRLDAFLKGNRPWLSMPASPAGGLGALLHDSGLERCRLLLAHLNYPDDALITRLARFSVSVAYCPRAHAYFDHAPHRWREMLAAGVNVCLGTDSLACTESLSILDEIRYLHSIARDCPPRALVEMATLRGARALGLDTVLGTLTVGKHADWIALPLDGPCKDPLDAVTRGDTPVCGVWIKGCRRV